jgi:hypothetical protein
LFDSGARAEEFHNIRFEDLYLPYGWKFSSDMPDIYISRAGMESKNLDEKFTQ